MKHKKYYLFLTKLYSVRKEVKIAFSFAVVSILLIQLFLKNYNALNKFLYELGDIYLKISYSIVAASIFYFINQHLPKEEKKLKLFRSINNKVHSIDTEIVYIIKNLNLRKHYIKIEITLEEITNACSQVNPMNQIFNIEESSTPFNNWYEYFNYKTEKIKALITDLLLLSDVIEPELVERLLTIDDVISNSLFFDKKRWGNKDLTTWAKPIYELKIASSKACEIKVSKYDRFWDEYINDRTKDNEPINLIGRKI